MKVKWTKYKNYGGPLCRGKELYNPSKPLSEWDRIMGVVARCEGKHDTTVMYDETGVTWGFLQWTFKSGRLQKLLESLKSIPSYNFEQEGEGDWTLFDDVCCTDKDIQIFEQFGFVIHGGRFVDATAYKTLDPSIKKDQKRIINICMGRVKHKDQKSQRSHAIQLATVFSRLGSEFGVAEAQVEFAKSEFKRSLIYKRPPLGDIKTIGNLLENTWGTPAPALFFNLWQNYPSAAYRLFKNVYNKDVKDVKGASDYGNAFFDAAWKRTCKSKFGNWGFGKPENKSPRVVRIKKALKEFYELDMKYYK